MLPDRSTAMSDLTEQCRRTSKAIQPPSIRTDIIVQIHNLLSTNPSCELWVVYSANPEQVITFRTSQHEIIYPLRKSQPRVIPHISTWDYIYPLRKSQPRVIYCGPLRSANLNIVSHIGLYIPLRKSQLAIDQCKHVIISHKWQPRMCQNLDSR